jgi:hypothetical protein
MEKLGLIFITFGLIGLLVPLVLVIQRNLHGTEEGNPYVAYINRIDRQISRVSILVSPPLLIVGIVVLVLR